MLLECCVCPLLARNVCSAEEPPPFRYRTLGLCGLPSCAGSRSAGLPLACASRVFSRTLTSLTQLESPTRKKPSASSASTSAHRSPMKFFSDSSDAKKHIRPLSRSPPPASASVSTSKAKPKTVRPPSDDEDEAEAPKKKPRKTRSDKGVKRWPRKKRASTDEEGEGKKEGKKRGRPRKEPETYAAKAKAALKAKEKEKHRELLEEIEEEEELAARPVAANADSTDWLPHLSTDNYFDLSSDEREAFLDLLDKEDVRNRKGEVTKVVERGAGGTDEAMGRIWRCATCGFDNVADLTTCEICEVGSLF
ncbi:hypothetical protein AAT19DRAFT_11548 [Rhodotorula toruloides]|uniref:RanBP2-type domain-containing protein n=1 Tax=Rhodotorula toruloides TaxID=5286 RepID=A0A2S9ZVW2_RHOTO|nr:hypothetical protein AAT19DRAFT_11548 [Rhodotorula toruloides]